MSSLDFTTGTAPTTAPQTGGNSSPSTSSPPSVSYTPPVREKSSLDKMTDGEFPSTMESVKTEEQRTAEREVTELTAHGTKLGQFLGGKYSDAEIAECIKTDPAKTMAFLQREIEANPEAHHQILQQATDIGVREYERLMTGLPVALDKLLSPRFHALLQKDLAGKNKLKYFGDVTVVRKCFAQARRDLAAEHGQVSTDPPRKTPEELNREKLLKVSREIMSFGRIRRGK